MEDMDFINIWKEQNHSVEKRLVIHETQMRSFIDERVKNSLSSLIKLKAKGIIGFIIYLLILVYILVYALSNYSSALNYFIFSVSSITLINLKGFTDYFKHIMWINSINYNGSLLEIQKHLTQLQISIIQHTRIMCLQFPFYTTFYLSNKWFPYEVGNGYLLLQFVITGSFVYLSYWLYKNLIPVNLSKKWFRVIIADSGGEAIMNALAFYKEIEDFQGNVDQKSS